MNKRSWSQYLWFYAIIIRKTRLSRESRYRPPEENDKETNIRVAPNDCVKVKSDSQPHCPFRTCKTLPHAYSFGVAAESGSIESNLSWRLVQEPVTPFGAAGPGTRAFLCALRVKAGPFTLNTTCTRTGCDRRTCHAAASNRGTLYLSCR